MKFLHIADLHFGIRLYGRALNEDQRDIAEKIVAAAEAERPDAVLIAGDVYDKSVPPAEAVDLFDDFIVRLSERVPHVFVIPGNHDSAERIAFGGRIMERSGVHMAPVYGGSIDPVMLEDNYGRCAVWMLPFLRPSAVRPFFPAQELRTYDDAFRAAAGALDIDPGVRNVIVAHQFVAGGLGDGSESFSVGNIENVSPDIFDLFDYAALGHLHRAQSVGRAEVRYAGTPLAYSFSEAKNEKSITVVELKEKGNAAIREIPLVPLRRVSTLRGRFDDLIREEYADRSGQRRDFLRIVLTDEQDVPDAAARLRRVYPELLTIEYDNSRTRAEEPLDGLPAGADGLSPEEIFADFFRAQAGRELSEAQRGILQDLLTEEGGGVD